MEVNLVRDRIRFLLNQKKVEVHQIAEDNKSRVRMNRQINENTELSCKTIETILAKFPDISAEWLLRGESSMLRSDNMAPRIYNSAIGTIQGANRGSQSINPDPSLQTSVEYMQKIVDMKDAEIQYLNKQIQELKDEKRELNKQLSILFIKIKKQ